MRFPVALKTASGQLEHRLFERFGTPPRGHAFFFTFEMVEEISNMDSPQIQPQSAPAPNQGQRFYLIAFSDHTIQAATAYKVDGDQIHWIGHDGAEKQAPLSTVDVQFSKQINRDRHRR
jgi:hypothetical protein